MSEARVTDTERMSVSIIAGPAAKALLAKVEVSPAVLIEELSGSSPDQIVDRIRSIAATRTVNDFIIECEPERPAMAYASLFASPDHDDSSLANVARLKTTVYAIDAAAFLDSILDRAPDSIPTTFMAEQMEFVDRIVFDGESPDFDLARSIAIGLNPRAQIFRLNEVNAEWWRIPAGPSFDFNAALAGAGWRRLIDGEEKSGMIDSRITAIGYSAWRPFHPERFARFLEKKSHGVLRAKGFFWLASRMDEVGGLNLAGADLHCSSAGTWWATRDAQSRETEMPEHARQQWKEPFGDRRQTFGIIALDVDRGTLQSTLDACLLTDAEMSEGPEKWREFPDPLPGWSHHHHHHHHDHDHDHDHEHDGECDHHHGSGEHHCCHH